MQEKLQAKELLTDIAIALRDAFIARVVQRDGKLLLRFFNGQNFCLTIQEIE